MLACPLVRAHLLSALLLGALPAFGQDSAAAARARAVMHEALEQELVAPALPPSLPTLARAEPGPPGREGPKGQGETHRSDVAAEHAEQASGEARQHALRGLERAAEERASAASDAAATQSRAAAAKKAAAGKGRPPRP